MLNVKAKDNKLYEITKKKKSEILRKKKHLRCNFITSKNNLPSYSL